MVKQKIVTQAASVAEKAKFSDSVLELNGKLLILDKQICSGQEIAEIDELWIEVIFLHLKYITY